jgi:hypothetical protein
VPDLLVFLRNAAAREPASILGWKAPTSECKQRVRIRPPVRTMHLRHSRRTS